MGDYLEEAIFSGLLLMFIGFICNAYFHVSEPGMFYLVLYFIGLVFGLIPKD